MRHILARRSMVLAVACAAALQGLGGPAAAGPSPAPTASPPVAFSDPLPLGFDFSSVAVGDMNNDGHLDLVGTPSAFDDETLSVLLGDGAGGFTVSTTVDLIAQNVRLVVADLNNDGRLDVAAGGALGVGLTLFFGDGQGGFSVTRVIMSNASVEELVVGDFDGDGAADLAAYLLEPSRIGVMYGDGTGRFTRPVVLAERVFADEIAAVDLSGDGSDDLLFTGPPGKALYVLVSRGRTFEPAAGYPTGERPSDFVVAHLNNDGHQDVVVITGEGFDDFADITVLLGDGTGGFGPPATMSGVGAPVDIAAAQDMDGDGIVDLVVMESRPFIFRDTITVRLGDGAGGFGSPTRFLTDFAFPNVVADLAGDEKPDILSGGVGSTDSVLRVNVSGDAVLRVSDVTVTEGVDTAATFTVTRSAFPVGRTSVRFATVDGTATAPEDYASTSGILRFAPGERARTVVVPIVDDALPEFDETFSLLLSDPVGAGVADPIGVATIVDDDLVLPPVSFAPPAALTTISESQASGLAVADLNGDGRADLVETTGGFVTPALAVSLGDGVDGVGPTQFYETATFPESVAAADLDGDGNVDVVLVGEDGLAAVRLGDGTGLLGPETDVEVAGADLLNDVAVGEFTGDGIPDLVVRSVLPHVVVVLAGDGDGGFGPAQRIAQGGRGEFEGLRVADLNGDGLDDIVAPDLAAGTVTVLLSTAPGTFARTDYPVSDDPGAVAIGDFDGDGALDLAVHADQDGGTGDDTVAVLLNDGSGEFGTPTLWPTQGGQIVLEAADFNGDGRIDLACVAFGQGAVLLGDGAGQFAPPTDIDSGPGFSRGTTADWNGDGLPDLVVGSGADSAVLINASS